jgi:ribose transport system permease protein
LKALLRSPAVVIAAVDIIAVLFFGLISPGHAFLSVSNFDDVALDGAEIVMITAGLSLVLAAGEIDISIGANVILSSVVGAKAAVALAGTSQQVQTGIYPRLGLALAVGIGAAIVVGIVVGILNGLLVAKARINSFIVTLAMLGMATGLAEVLTGGLDVAYVPSELATGFGLYKVAGVLPAPALVGLAFVIFAWYLLTKTRFGLRTAALGSSRPSVQRVGVRVETHLVVLFAIAGMTAGIAGVMDISRFTGTDLSGHQTDALAAIAGVVIGGANLFGGETSDVSVPGAFFGALLAVILQVGLVIQGLSTFYQPIVVGAVVLIAVFARSRGNVLRPFRTRAVGRANPPGKGTQDERAFPDTVPPLASAKTFRG